LNFLSARNKKKKVIPDKIAVSFQILTSPSPFNITDFTMIKYHLAGTMFDITCSGFGMFSMGNMNPLSIRVGKNIPTSEANIAVRCESVIVEISNPNDNDVIMNRTDSEKSNNRLPLMGSSSTK
jgi:hypothetical protein